MSQELIGRCGAVVGSSEYFQRINQGTVFAPFMVASDGYQYSFAVEALCSRCAAVIDDIYSDLQKAEKILPTLSDEYRENLLQLITNLEDATNFLLPSFSSANNCRALLSKTEATEDDGLGLFGIWGSDIGSYGYLQSKCSSIFSSIFSDPLVNIVQLIISDLTVVAEQIASDIDTGMSSHHYVKDDNGDALHRAILELERCNCSAISSYGSKVNSLCWYQEIASSDVLALQKALNKIPGSGTLTEDGIYGEKTSNA